MPKFDRTRLIFGLYLLVIIAAFELLIGHFKVPGWPAYVAMIFFFVEHMDVKKAPAIVVGGTFGIGLILLARPIIGALAPLVGVELAGLVFVLALVYSIVAFGEMVPMLFNNYAFMTLTVTGVAVRQPNPNPFLWMAIAAVGGAALIAGVIGIGRLMMAQAAAKQPAASTTSSA
ncbi:MAG TPA: hypothetical protein VHC69_10915 [Polyangiaceae bacterium]|nr:hypothetical protein [Polyangiaceae bacterium]